jgi:hypothetical protein
VADPKARHGFHLQNDLISIDNHCSAKVSVIFHPEMLVDSEVELVASD